MILSLNNISKSYGKGKKALDDFSMEFSPGVYGLLGPNGAGKSTLMNIITDNIRPDFGDTVYDGKSIRSMGEEYRNILGYMPQQQKLYDNFTGEEFLWYMAALKGIDKTEKRETIKKLLETVNLSEAATKRIGAYSGGMKQRILIAQAMLNDPEILIMDEPTAGLDPSERIRIRNYLSTISEHKIVIIATHLVSDIEFIAKEVILLRDGRIIKSESPHKLINDMIGKVYEIEMAIDEEYNYNNAKIANISMSLNGKIYRIITDEKISAPNLKPVTPTLEDVYLYYLE